MKEFLMPFIFFNNSLTKLASFFIILSLFVFCYGIDNDRINKILFSNPCKYHLISQEDAKWLLSNDNEAILSFIRSSFDPNKKENLLPSQQAILFLGLFGTLKDTSIILSTYNSEIDCKSELPPCEYYCSYNTAKTSLKIRFSKGTPPPLQTAWPQWTSKIEITSIQDDLNLVPEEIVAKSLFDKKKRIKFPDKIANEIDEEEKESFYDFSVYFNLYNRGKSITSIESILEKLLYLYGRDVSGDGGVLTLETVLFKILYRNINN